MRPNRSSLDENTPEELARVEANQLFVKEIQSLLQDQGPASAVDELIRNAKEKAQPRPLLDALLLKARLDLGLSPTGVISELLPADLKMKYEDRYVEALRSVGQMLLDRSDIPAAWPYFRVIGEKEPVRIAIENFDPGQADEHALGAVIDIAFQQQVHPIKGFSWVLDRYGICSAISSFEAIPGDEKIRAEAAAMLTKALYDQLQYSLASEIERRDGQKPSESATVVEMITGKTWIYDDDAYAIDVSHLSSVVRLSPLLKDASSIAFAVQLAQYGSGLSDRFRYDGLPPFEDIYADHAIYLNALIGKDVETAVKHFQSKVQKPSVDEDQPADPLETLPAQTLVRLLARLGRIEEAISVASEHLMEIPDSYLLCPTVSALCRDANRPDLLAQAAVGVEDWALYLGARIEEMQLKTEA
jgi:hypothetical protein